MKTQRHALASSPCTDDRLCAARAHLASAIAEAAAQGTIGESEADRLASVGAQAPRDDVDRELFAEQAERLQLAMSYFNDLHGEGRLETDLVRSTFALDDPELICAVVEATRRDTGLIEHRLDASVRSGILDEVAKAQVLAKPHLNQQAADALEAFSAIATRGK